MRNISTFSKTPLSRSAQFLSLGACLLAAACAFPQGQEGEFDELDESVAAVNDSLTHADTTSGFPSVVQLGLPGAICSGSLVTNQVVLTAAHCVESFGDEFKVSISLGKSDGSPKSVFNDRVRVTLHPDHHQLGFDIAILTTLNDKTIPGGSSMPLYSGKRRPWRVPVDVSNPNKSTGLSFDLVAFGRGSSGGACSSTRRKRRGTGLFSGYLVNGPAGLPELDFLSEPRIFRSVADPAQGCHGDSGGAVVFGGHQVGVISSGMRNWDTPDRPDLQFDNLNHTAVAPHLDWLKEAVADAGIEMTCEERGTENLVWRNGAIDHERSTSSRHLICSRPQPPAPGPYCTWKNVTGGGGYGLKYSAAIPTTPCQKTSRSQWYDDGELVATAYHPLENGECIWRLDNEYKYGTRTTRYSSPIGPCQHTVRIEYIQHPSLDPYYTTYR